MGAVIVFIFSIHIFYFIKNQKSVLVPKVSVEVYYFSVADSELLKLWELKVRTAQCDKRQIRDKRAMKNSFILLIQHLAHSNHPVLNQI